MGSCAHSKLIFACHSRGGLVARATAVRLHEKSKELWQYRICGCITFGTPHEGADLVEHKSANLGTCILAGRASVQIAGLADISSYLGQREEIRGIRDMQPPGAGSMADKDILKELKQEESRQAPTSRRRNLPIHAVGGLAPEKCESNHRLAPSRLGQLVSFITRRYIFLYWPVRA